MRPLAVAERSKATGVIGGDERRLAFIAQRFGYAKRQHSQREHRSERIEQRACRSAVDRP